MFSRDQEEEILLANDHAAEPVQARHMLDILPKDMQKYLLTFCDVQEIGRLAQVDRKFHGLINDASFQTNYEARRIFSIMVADVNGDTDIQSLDGYVSGSYAQLRNFFTGRDSEEQQLANLNAKEACCLVCAAGSICACAGEKIMSNKNKRDALRSQLLRKPGIASLKGAMFSWEPTAKHKDYIPPKLGMNE